MDFSLKDFVSIYLEWIFYSTLDSALSAKKSNGVRGSETNLSEGGVRDLWDDSEMNRSEGDIRDSCDFNSKSLSGHDRISENNRSEDYS